MSMRTDTRFSDADIRPRSVLTLLVVAAIIFGTATGVLEETRSGWLRSGMRDSWQMVLQTPPTLAFIVTMENAIKEFAGRPPATLTPRMIAYLLASILLMGIVGPTMLFLSQRRAATEPPAALLRTGTIVGMMLGGIWMVMALPSAVSFYYSRMEIREAQSVQRTKDEMINELNDLAMSAQVYYWKPQSMGGGGQSYAGFSPVLPEMPFGQYSMDISSSSLRITGVPLHDPRTRYSSASGSAPEASVSVTVDSVGGLREWKYLGLFN